MYPSEKIPISFNAISHAIWLNNVVDWRIVYIYIDQQYTHRDVNIW